MNNAGNSLNINNSFESFKQYTNKTTKIKKIKKPRPQLKIADHPQPPGTIISFWISWSKSGIRNALPTKSMDYRSLMHYRNWWYFCGTRPKEKWERPDVTVLHLASLIHNLFIFTICSFVTKTHPCPLNPTYTTIPHI